MSLRRPPFPFLASALAAVSVALWFFPGATAALELDVGGSGSGGWWGLLTGHFTHWTADHLAWDVLAFLILGAVVEARSRRLLAATVVASALVVSAAVLVVHPAMSSYRGLSGLDSALFAAATMGLLLDSVGRRRPLNAIVPAIALVGFVAKSAFEFGTGTALFVDPGAVFVPVPVAHLAGAVSGAIVAAIHLRAWDLWAARDGGELSSRTRSACQPEHAP